MNKTIAWMRFQAPYALHCLAYFPVTTAKRLVLTSRRGYWKTDPLLVRAQHKWALGWQVPRLQDVIWVSMYSGGEALKVRPVLDGLRETGAQLVLATESYDSYQLLRETCGAAAVIFPPWDLAPIVGRALRQFRPRAVVMVDNAFYPLLLKTARSKGIPTFLINGRMDPVYGTGSTPLRRGIALGAYAGLTAIGAGSETDYEGFLELGIPAQKLEVTGELRVDYSQEGVNDGDRLKLRRQLGLSPANQVIIAGSTHVGELDVLFAAYARVSRQVPDAKLIIAPRLLREVPVVMTAVLKRGWRGALLTSIKQDPGPPPEFDVLVVDTFGELRRLYAATDVCFIGTSLVPINERRGGHNILEPLAHGTPTLFGPNMRLWEQETSALRKDFPSLQVHGPEELADRMIDILTGRLRLPGFKEKADEIVRCGGGATERTLSFLRRQLAQ